MGLQEFLGPQPANAAKSAFGPDLNRAPQGARLFRNLPLLELLCLAPGGAVTGYSRDGSGAVCAHRAADPAEDAAFHTVVKHVQDGAIAGVAAWAPEIHAQALSAAELRAPALARWEKLLAAPPRVLRHALAQHKHDERFGRGRFGTPAARRNWLQRLLH